MSNLLLKNLTNAISFNNTAEVRKICEKNNYTSVCKLYNLPDCEHTFSLSMLAVENGNPDIFEILFTWSQNKGSIYLFNYAIGHNKLPIVKYLYPLVKDDLNNFDREISLENANEAGFGDLHAWLETAYHPQIAFDRWQAEWGFDVETIFSGFWEKLKAKYNADIATGLIDEDGEPIAKKSHDWGCPCDDCYI